jgi:chemotaxis protein methyltransferase WspC
MNLAPILDLLAARTGLDAGSLGAHAVESAVAGRLRAVRLEADAYIARVAADPVEFAELVHEVVVPETWFFRGGNLFSYLAEHIRNSPVTPFRVLSLPCSTGEEPYSLAIALAEAGLPAPRCAIDGVDLSIRSVEAARRGIFRELSFRQTPAELRKRYFRATPAGWEIEAGLRTRVRFLTGNLLTPGLLPSEKPYDLVFCRNLFIYLTPQARRQGMDTLARLVAPGGLLCLGHAEALASGEGRFDRRGPEEHFLYRRLPPKAIPAASQTPPRPPSQSLPEVGAVESSIPPVAMAVLDSLHRARELANLGQYDEALEQARLAQERFGPSAELYCLLGVIHQARHDRAAAGRFFTRALYLSPNHHEALVHLMLLCQLEGARDRAAVLRRRLEELPGPGGEP